MGKYENIEHYRTDKMIILLCNVWSFSFLKCAQSINVCEWNVQKWFVSVILEILVLIIIGVGGGGGWDMRRKWQWLPTMVSKEKLEDVIVERLFWYMYYFLVVAVGVGWLSQRCRTCSRVWWWCMSLHVWNGHWWAAVGRVVWMALHLQARLMIRLITTLLTTGTAARQIHTNHVA